MDGLFKKPRFPKIPSKGKSNGPVSGASLPENMTNLEGHVVPNISRVQEEPQLIAPSDSDLAQPASTVQPGDDPLSQFAAKSLSPLGERTAVVVNALPGAGGLQNHREELAEGEGQEGGVAQYGRYLSEGDHRSIRRFVLELVAKRLLPHLNEVLRNLNEWVRKGGAGGVELCGLYSSIVPTMVHV